MCRTQQICRLCNGISTRSVPMENNQAVIADGSQRKEGYRIIGTIITILRVIKDINVKNVGKTISPQKTVIFQDPLIATNATKQATKPSFVTCIPNRKSAMGCQLNLIMIAFGLIIVLLII